MFWGFLTGTGANSGRLAGGIKRQRCQILKKVMALHVSLAFARAKDSDLDEKASTVASQLDAHATLFPALPVMPAAIAAARTDFHDAIVATDQSGSAATADKNNKRATLVDALRQDGKHIENIPGLTLENALLSGYDVTETGHYPPVILIVPVILGITNVATGQLGIKLQGSPGALGYEFQVTVGTGAPVSAGFFSSTRGIVLVGLVTGTKYAVQVRARGGNNQFSDWSDPVSHVAT